MSSSKAHLEACARYRERNRERVRAATRRSKQKNKERVYAYNKEWAKQNRQSRKRTAGKYRAANKDKIAAAQAIRTARYYAKNKKLMFRQMAAWNEANPEKRAAIRRRYREANLAFVGLLQKRRSERRDHATPSWAITFFMNEAYELARRRTKTLGFKWSVDHMVPILGKTVCGLHAHTNIQVIPHKTNGRKSNLYWPDMPEMTHGDQRIV